MTPAAAVLVIGSVNQDFTVRVDRFPGPGETVVGLDVAYALGGKGANQAVACARTGTSTALLATVGDDAAGRELTSELARLGVDIALVTACGLPTGTAHILVDARGENQIVVVPGANTATSPVRVADVADAVAGSAVVVLQAEVPVATIERAVATAGGIVVLNLAPVLELSPETLARVDILVVNEVEAGLLLGHGVTAGNAMAAAERLTDRCRAVVVTLGPGGAVWAGKGGGRAGAPVVEAVDTTGAGDAFVGVLAAAISSGRPLAEAVRSGVRAASEVVLVFVELEVAVPRLMPALR